MNSIVHNSLSYSVAGLLYVIAPFPIFVKNDIPLMIRLLWIVHFTKRVFEVLKVHRFQSSKKTPLLDCIIEYVYYWGFGIWIGYTLPTNAEFDAQSPLFTICGVLLFTMGEFGNGYHHEILANLRKTKEDVEMSIKKIPYGGFFEYVTCPHYFFEIVGWFGFVVLIRSTACIAFFITMNLILVQWAKERHLAYRTNFFGVYTKLGRKILYPGIY